MSNPDRPGKFVLVFALGVLVPLALTRFVNRDPAPAVQSVQAAAATPAAETSSEPREEQQPTESQRTDVLVVAPVVQSAVSTSRATVVVKNESANVSQNSFTSSVQTGVASASSVSPVQYTFVLPRANNSGRLTGSAKFVGEPPAEKIIPVDRSCGRLHETPLKTRLYAVGKDGALADVLVRITAGLPEQAWQVPQEPLRIAARNCMFEPYVSGVLIGQTIVLENHDLILHNAHIIPAMHGNRQRNYAMLPSGKDIQFTFDTSEEFIRIKGDVRPWMFAYVSVFTHPFFAVTDANGNFTLPELPPGNYTISATHRKSGTLTQTIEIGADSAPRVEFQFTAPGELARK